MLYSYTQRCDPLVDAGWEIAGVDQSNQRSIERSRTFGGNYGSFQRY